VARITNSSRILDPYAGSCATLLAAAMIAPESETVGIEIANDWMVNRDDIRKDFATRQLSQPKALLEGDCVDPDMRRQARDVVGSQPFDVIVADPPYGIRESTGFNENSPMEELFACIANDRDEGKRLLKKGGRLVAFVPVTDEETLREMLPESELTERAGLKFEVCREQPLNEKLSRWLVSFVCTR
jgi:tRNA G10  N-methylase Trm11